MRIGIDAARAFRQPQTGTERYAWQILRGLLNHPAAPEHTWHLFVDQMPSSAALATLMGKSAHAPASPPPHINWKVLPWRRMWTHRVLGPAVRQEQLDVLFVPSHVIPFALPRQANPRTVVTVHDLGYRHWPQTHPLAQRLYLEWSTRWNLAAASQVISVSHATARDIERVMPGTRHKLTVIHEAAEAISSPSTHAQTTARQKFDLPSKYAIFIGTLHPRKNIERLIRAYARLHLAGQMDWPLVLIGAGGWQADEFRRQAAELTGARSDASPVRFLGYVPQAQAEALLSGAHMFLFPSLFEGFGLPVLEAQALGVPVMTSNSSSLPEVAGDAALYVDPTDVDALADAMLRLSRDEELRARLIAAGYENVKRFSWEKAAAETFAVLRQAAEGSSPPTSAPQDSGSETET